MLRGGHPGWLSSNRCASLISSEVMQKWAKKQREGEGAGSWWAHRANCISQQTPLQWWGLLSLSLSDHTGGFLLKAINLCNFSLPPGAWWNQQGTKGKLLLDCSGASRKHKCHSFGGMSELFLVGAPLGVHNSLYGASVSYPFLWQHLLGNFCKWIKASRNLNFPLQSHTAHTLVFVPLTKLITWQGNKSGSSRLNADRGKTELSFEMFSTVT